jgi:hypothetical protein
MPDLVVCFILSVADPSWDSAFCNAFFSVFESNPGLASQTLAVQIVSSGHRASERGGHARAFAASFWQDKLFGEVAPIHVFEDRSLGRCLNDAFLWAIASDGAAHWLVWDDAHACTRPFLRSARNVMDGPARWPLSQLMLEGAWVADLPPHRKVEDDGFRYVLPCPKDSADFIDHASAETWPGFVLSPAWHRLAFLRRAVRDGYVSLKPFPEGSFETWDTLQRVFGKMWQEAGAVSGELLPSPCVYVDACFMDDTSPV